MKENSTPKLQILFGKELQFCDNANGKTLYRVCVRNTSETAVHNVRVELSISSKNRVRYLPVCLHVMNTTEEKDGKEFLGKIECLAPDEKKYIDVIYIANNGSHFQIAHILDNWRHCVTSGNCDMEIYTFADDCPKPVKKMFVIRKLVDGTYIFIESRKISDFTFASNETDNIDIMQQDLFIAQELDWKTTAGSPTSTSKQVLRELGITEEQKPIGDWAKPMSPDFPTPGKIDQPFDATNLTSDNC